MYGRESLCALPLGHLKEREDKIMTLGEKIKALRTQRGITQEAFAEHLSVSRSAIAKWESDIGVPEIINLKAIAKTFGISIDELLDEEQEISLKWEMRTDMMVENSKEAKPVEASAYACAEYADSYCNIELNGWNDGVSQVILCGEDEDFLYYQRVEKQNTLYGLIGKNYITSVTKTKKAPKLSAPEMVNKEYFCNKHVCIEIAHKEGLLKGFFDFRNDDYLNVIIAAFREGKAHLEFGRTLNVEEITKIEEIPG